MCDKNTAIQWAKDAGFQTAKGPTLFHLVTPEQVQALVNRVRDDAFKEAAAACVHYQHGEAEDMAKQCEKHILALLDTRKVKALS